MSESNLVLENELYCVEFDFQHGRLVRLFDKQGGYEIVTEPRLGDNWRLLLPLPELQANYLDGRDQDLSRYEQEDHKLVLHWDGPLTNAQGEWQVSVTMCAELVEERLELSVQVDNGTDLELWEVWFGMVAGMQGLGSRGGTVLLEPAGGSGRKINMFEWFPESMGVGGGTPGSRYPEYFTAYPYGLCVPFIDYYNEGDGRGLYMACYDQVTRVKILRWEMHPGIRHQSEGGNWPLPEQEDEDWPMGVMTNWVMLPFQVPGESYQTPVAVIQAHPGDWHQAAEIYREWYTANFELSDPLGTWMDRQLSAQDAFFMLPEGNINVKYEEIAQWAADAAKYGIESVLISGWDQGGHDARYPYYEPDYRLGDWDQLEQGIAACHELGMKVFFFMNVSPVDMNTEWYEEELYKYRSQNRAGKREQMGWGMGTLAARIGVSTALLTSCSPGFPEFRKIIVDQAKKLAEIGADGIHIDKLPPMLMDFNPDLPLPPDQASWAGIIETLREIREACEPIKPDWGMSTEAAWDRVLEFANPAWCWHSNSRGADHTPVLKYTFSQWKPCYFVSQAYDYMAVNSAVRYGYQLYVGPARYTASLDDPQHRPLARYTQQVLEMYQSLRSVLYEGEFRDQLEGSVEGDEQIRWSSHRNLSTGQRAIVLVNAGLEVGRARVAFTGAKRGKVELHVPGEEAQEMEGTLEVEVAPDRVAVLVESA